RLLGTATDTRVAELAGAVLEGDARRALELLGRAADEGLQLGELLDQLLAYWRDLMVVNCAGTQVEPLSVSGQQKETLASQARALKLDSILAGLDILTSTKARLRASGQARVLLEMALVRLTRLDDLVALSQLAEWMSQAPASPADSRAGSRPAATASPPEAS